MSNQKPSATIHRKADDEAQTIAQKSEQGRSWSKIQNDVVSDFSKDCQRWQGV
jgi:hypothetical protein